MRASERGNAIIFILIAIALFAALSYTFMRSSQKGQGNLTAGQAKLAAQEILSYGVNVQRAVEKLLARGCSETQISFENIYDYNSDHVNPNAPPSKECHVFDPAGGGVTPLEDRWSGDIFYFTGSDAISGVGTTCTQASCAELSMNLWSIPQNLCDELNRQAGNTYSSLPSNAGLCGGPYNGQFKCTSNVRVVFGSGVLLGKKATCYNHTGSGGYGPVFNMVIMER